MNQYFKQDEEKVVIKNGKIYTELFFFQTNSETVLTAKVIDKKAIPFLDLSEEITAAEFKEQFKKNIKLIQTKIF